MTTVIKREPLDAHALALDATRRAFTDYFRSMDPHEYSVASLSRVAYHTARSMPGDTDTFNEILESIEQVFLPAVAEFIVDEGKQAEAKSYSSYLYEVRNITKQARLGGEYIICQRQLARRAICSMMCHAMSLLKNAVNAHPEMIVSLQRCLFAAALLLTLITNMADADRSEVAGLLDSLSDY